MVMLALIAATVVSMTTPSFNEDGTVLTDLAGVDIYICGNEQPYDTWLGNETGKRISFFVGTTLYKRCFEARAFDEVLNYSALSEQVRTRRFRCYSCHD
jgi:hypothetical protein